MSTEKQGTIQEFGSSQNGKPKVKIDGHWYFLGRVKLDGVKVGDAISFEASAFGERGNLWGLDKWGRLPSAPQPAQQSNGRDHALPEGERLCVSNWVGQAIAAGAIKNPEDIEKWVGAARGALRSQSHE